MLVYQYIIPFANTPQTVSRVHQGSGFTFRPLSSEKRMKKIQSCYKKLKSIVIRCRTSPTIIHVSSCLIAPPRLSENFRFNVGMHPGASETPAAGVRMSGCTKVQPYKAVEFQSGK